jgi:hypothetical protein
MRACPLFALALALALVGCSIPTKPGAPFACNGDAVPTTAPATVSVSGVVTDPVMTVPIGSATETAFVVVSPSPLMTFTTKTDASGAFVASEMTGDAAHAQFFQSRATGYLDTYTYPPLPVAGDVDASTEQFTSSELAEFAGGGSAIDPATAVMIVSVFDCNNDPVAGATVTLDPDTGTKVYIAGGLPSPTATATDAATGSMLVGGLADQQAIRVTAKLDGVTFQTTAVTTTANALTIAEVSP